MSARNDFALTIDRAAGLTLDATCAARCAGAGPLPHSHRRLLGEVIVALEKAQDGMYKLRHYPWDQPQPPRARQLELL